LRAHSAEAWWHQLKAVKARLEQRATVTPLERILVTLHIISKAIALKLVPTNALVLTGFALQADASEDRKSAGSSIVSARDGRTSA
jgi:hypothetical protein